MSDIVIPIVFPDYRIVVNLPKQEVDLIPYVTFDNFTTPEYKDNLSNLGHAGVLFINGNNGITKYFEYGRYDPPAFLGLVRKIRNLPDATIKEGKIDISSLKGVLKKISKVSGQSGRISGVYIEVENKFAAMLEYAQLRKSQNAYPKRKPYDLLWNSCIHFVKGVTKKAGVENPWMIDPRPNSYIGEFREDYLDLDYSYTSNELVIEDLGTY
ncbi:hypothetical protein SG34_027855 [Thalassomonas viridans]|uniref:Type VI secretion system effector TseH-like domain-containing protein n=1 Tax=Thalassomonas viridans TaxID=137584 RepID=A0AAF0C942_9GAMM|nr:hypothetical protein [Thalassomonas viridans]WDE05071.1 hypothetical protein SG34_027855 [Thalassomonas viridans]